MPHKPGMWCVYASVALVASATDARIAMNGAYLQVGSIIATVGTVAIKYITPSSWSKSGAALSVRVTLAGAPLCEHVDDISVPCASADPGYPPLFVCEWRGASARVEIPGASCCRSLHDVDHVGQPRMRRGDFARVPAAYRSRRDSDARVWV